MVYLLNLVIFHSFLYVYQRVNHHFLKLDMSIQLVDPILKHHWAMLRHAVHLEILQVASNVATASSDTGGSLTSLTRCQ